MEESKIIQIFRRNSLLARSEADVSDKLLKRIVRKTIPFKPKDGRYIGLELPTSGPKGREANKRALALAAEMKVRIPAGYKWIVNNVIKKNKTCS